MESITGAPKSTLSGRGTAHDSEGLLGRRCSDRHPAGWVGGAAIYFCNYYKINNCGRGGDFWQLNLFHLITGSYWQLHNWRVRCSLTIKINV